jgi:chromosome segregation ATPase
MPGGARLRPIRGMNLQLRLRYAQVSTQIVGCRAQTRRGAHERRAIAFAPMSEDTTADGLRSRLARQGEDALGRLAQDLLENPLINGAIARAFEAREKAAQAQEVALGALNLPTASDIERLTRRVRSLSQRLEGIEDGVDRLDERMAALQASLDGMAKELAALRKDTPAKRAAPAAKRASSAKSGT